MWAGGWVGTGSEFERTRSAHGLENLVPHGIQLERKQVFRAVNLLLEQLHAVDEVLHVHSRGVDDQLSALPHNTLVRLVLVVVQYVSYLLQTRIVCGGRGG